MCFKSFVSFLLVLKLFLLSFFIFVFREEVVWGVGGRRVGVDAFRVGVGVCGSVCGLWVPVGRVSVRLRVSAWHAGAWARVCVGLRAVFLLNFFLFLSNSIVYSSHARHVSIWCDCFCVVR